MNEYSDDLCVILGKIKEISLSPSSQEPDKNENYHSISFCWVRFFFKNIAFTSTKKGLKHDSCSQTKISKIKNKQTNNKNKMKQKNNDLHISMVDWW